MLLASSSVGPVLLVLTITTAMYKPDKDAIVRSAPSERVTAHHAVLALGSGHADGADYLLVRNSWGQRWGDRGHGWLHDPYLAPKLITTAVIS